MLFQRRRRRWTNREFRRFSYRASTRPFGLFKPVNRVVALASFIESLITWLFVSLEALNVLRDADDVRAIPITTSADVMIPWMKPPCDVHVLFMVMMMVCLSSSQIPVSLQRTSQQY